jgi:hypothetical protein
VNVLLLGCHGAAAPTPATVASPAGSTPAQEASAAPAYPMCGGQNLPPGGTTARTGASEVQLGPAFLDEMAACGAADSLPKQAIPTADGHINAKGDCEFSNGVSCHFHSGSEFLVKGTTKQTAGQGELHCIFPSSEPKSPRVYGGHVVCRNHAQGEVHGPAASHEVKEGSACPAAIVQQIQPCTGFRCCDDGTLTGPIADLVRDHRNDIRPDFRICEDTLEVDCDLLASYTAHAANCPALGGVQEPVFAPGHH